MIDISISLISVNQQHRLEKLFPSLIPAARQVNSEILLVENRCSDGTSEFLYHNYPQVSVIHNPEKTGYGGNHNLNLARARGRYFVIMNTDMSIPQLSTFVDLMDYMEVHLDIGILSPKILNPDGSIQPLNRRYPAIFDLFLRRFAPDSLKQRFKKRLDRYEMLDAGYDTEYDVEFLSGAFMFCRTNVLKSVGGFDPRYFLYFEDVDLCQRIQKKSRTSYFPGVSVIHFHEHATHKSFFHMRQFIISGFKCFNRWGCRIA